MTFYATKGGSGGIGLGLNMVYNLITEKMRGKINFASKRDEGISIAIIVPIQKQDFK